MAHTIEVLDASIRGLPVDTLIADGTAEKPRGPAAGAARGVVHSG